MSNVHCLLQYACRASSVAAAFGQRARLACDWLKLRARSSEEKRPMTLVDAKEGMPFFSFALAMAMRT